MAAKFFTCFHCRRKLSIDKLCSTNHCKACHTQQVWMTPSRLRKKVPEEEKTSRLSIDDIAKLQALVEEERPLNPSEFADLDNYDANNLRIGE